MSSANDDMLWRPLDSNNIANPYPMYARIRETNPVYQAHTGEWIITGYDVVKAIAQDRRVIAVNTLAGVTERADYLATKQIHCESFPKAVQSFPFVLNPPQHKRIRQLIHRAWDDRRVTGIIQENIDCLLAKLGNGKVELVDDYARPLPALTIVRILGLPRDDHNRLRVLAESVLKGLELYTPVRDCESSNKAAEELVEYLDRVIGERKQERGADLISKLITQNEIDKNPLTDSEFISVCLSLLISAQVTTSGLISMGIYNLLNHPDQLCQLRARPELIETAVEELLRFDTSAPVFGRTASENCEFGGQFISQGSDIILCFGAANRDPMVFSNPDDLDINRRPNPHLAFGAGIHSCFGSWLARIQGGLGIQALVSRYSGMRLDIDTPTWSRNLVVRALESLPVSVTA